MNVLNTPLSRRQVLRCSSLSLAALAGAPAALTAGGALGPRREELRVITLSGSALERGRAHGEELRPVIRAAMVRWMKSLTPLGSESVESYVANFVRDTAFTNAIEKHTPGMLDEVRGIAEGAAIPYETLFAMQCVDEDWWYSINARLKGTRRGSDPADDPADGKGDKCTVVAVPGSDSRPTLVGQNLDLPRWPAEAMVLLRNRPDDGPESLIVTIAGLVGANGINAAGVSVCVNTLLQLDNSIRGLPVAFVVRGILRRGDLPAARSFVEKVPHASGQAYTLGSRAGAVCLEASANKVVALEPAATDGRFVHTNHPLINDDRGLIGRNMRESERDSSHVRLTCADARIGAISAEPSVKELRAALTSHDSDDHPICNHLEGERGGFTAASVVFELGEQPRMHVAGALPCRNPYRVLGF